jgi:hypothetical protein
MQGTGAPTWPMVRSEGSVSEMTHALSVMPYPSSTTGKHTRRNVNTWGGGGGSKEAWTSADSHNTV